MDLADPDAPLDEAAPAEVTPRMRQWARKSAADYLSKHSSSVANLRKVMLRRAGRKHPDVGKAGAAQLAEEAVAFCRELGFVDDGAYAEAKVRSGVRKGHSRRRITVTLAQKGIDREISAEALGSTDDLAAAAAYARRKKIGPWRKAPLDAEAWKKEAAAFGRNGFSGETAREIMRMSAEEAEDAIFAAERNA
ncbi:MAG TPA: RecX family transcriptional regulator [Mesorhizobium sp.]|nr:RecX family transcriptional regulator [Mesorhizobium sp.]